jgi:hypothetical protein
MPLGIRCVQKEIDSDVQIHLHYETNLIKHKKRLTAHAGEYYKLAVRLYLGRWSAKDSVALWKSPRKVMY